jgi:hypothetical protein
MALNLVPEDDDELSAATEQRLDDLRNALIASAPGQKLFTFQHGAILAFACAHAEGDPRGIVSERLEKLAIADNLVGLAGGQNPFQHILSEASRARRALTSPRVADIVPLRAPLTIAEWTARELPAPDFLMGKWMTTTSRILQVAPTGIGKTTLVLHLGMAASAGMDFLHWSGCRPCKILYVDGEMSRRLLKQRILDAARRLGCEPTGFHALSHEDISDFHPLNTSQGQDQLEREIAKIGDLDFLIFDSVMCLLIGDMKEEAPWAQVMPWVRSLTRRNIGQMWVNHTGHDESRQYGTKTREWQMDTVLFQEPVKREGTDVSFNLEFRKARERTPATRSDFRPVRVALVDDAWKYEDAQPTPKKPPSPLGLKFLDALRNALIDSQMVVDGRKAVGCDAWQAECVRLGLIDKKQKPDSARAMFSRYRRELIAAARIGCDGDLSWLI